MLGDNLKQLRKQKGITQESLAIQLHVVRQTVSKWEKNLSVPDAEMLQRISEVLDVPVNTLLGANLPTEQERNEIAEQLSRLNEQLAIRNRRARRIWTIVGIALAAILLITLITNALGATDFHRAPLSVQVTLSDDPLYDQAEVEAAIETLQRYFRKEYSGFTLQSIVYDEDLCAARCEDLALETGYDQVIILLAGFQTDDRVGDSSWRPNATYKNTEWYFGRNDGGLWTLCGESK